MVFTLDPKLVSAIHVLIVAPLLILVGQNKVPDQYRQYILYLGVGVGLYHLFRLMKLMNVVEGMCQLDGTNVRNIKMFDSSPGFENPNLTVKVGEIVVWTNVGEVEHTVTSDNLDFNSGYLKPGESFSVKFTNPGKYNYHSIPDKGWMVGCITVQ